MIKHEEAWGDMMTNDETHWTMKRHDETGGDMMRHDETSKQIMRCDETLRWNIFMRHFYETVWWVISMSFVMRHFDEKF